MIEQLHLGLIPQFVKILRLFSHSKLYHIASVYQTDTSCADSCRKFVKYGGQEHRAMFAKMHCVGRHYSIVWRRLSTKASDKIPGLASKFRINLRGIRLHVTCNQPNVFQKGTFISD